MNTTTTTPPVAEQPASVWEDFIDIFYTPSAVFARRSQGRFLVPLLVLTAIVTLLFVIGQNVLAPIFEAEFRRAAESAAGQAPEMTAAQMEQMGQVQRIFGVLGFAVGFPVTVLLVGLTLWLVGKLFDATLTVAVAIMVATYAEFPRMLEQLLALGQGFLLDPAALDSRYSITLSLARFLDPDAAAPIVVALAGRVDLFILWVTVLLGIGLHVLGRVPRDRAALAAGIVWVAGALPQLAGALMAR